MFKIHDKKVLADQIFEMKIGAPEVAEKAKAGQFIILRIDEHGERIPLTIADHDEKGIFLVFQAVGRSTFDLSLLNQDDHLLDFVGPLGKPTEIENFGTVVCVGGGVGIAPIHPIARDLKKAGNRVISIIGARNTDLLFWREQMKEASSELHIVTDDGSEGMKGFVTDALKKIIEIEKIDRVIAIGPPIMMKFVSQLTKGYDIPTVASINSIMIDGVGMCGACRVEVDGVTKFACVDGPEFDGHKVDWDILMNRNHGYVQEERHAANGVGLAEHVAKKCDL